MAQVDALGRRTEFEYDEVGRLVLKRLPLAQEESYEYDEAGRMISKTDFNGATTAYLYDDENRLLRKDYPDGTFVENTYTLTGKLDTVTDSRGVTDYDYDAMDRITRITTPFLGKTISYTYNAAGQKETLTTDQGVVSYAYDELNRLKTVTRGMDVTTYSYDDRSRLVREDRPNGTYTLREYDDLDRATRIEHHGPAGLLASFAYEYDDVGNRTAITEFQVGSSGAIYFSGGSVRLDADRREDQPPSAVHGQPGVSMRQRRRG